MEWVKEIGRLQTRLFTHFENTHYHMPPGGKGFQFCDRNTRLQRLRLVKPEQGTKRATCIQIEIDSAIANRKGNANGIWQAS